MDQINEFPINETKSTCKESNFDELPRTKINFRNRRKPLKESELNSDLKISKVDNNSNRLMESLFEIQNKNLESSDNKIDNPVTCSKRFQMEKDSTMVKPIKHSAKYVLPKVDLTTIIQKPTTSTSSKMSLKLNNQQILTQQITDPIFNKKINDKSKRRSKSASLLETNSARKTYLTSDKEAKLGSILKSSMKHFEKEVISGVVTQPNTKVVKIFKNINCNTKEIVGRNYFVASSSPNSYRRKEFKLPIDVSMIFKS